MAETAAQGHGTSASGVPVGLACPFCGEPPVYLLGGGTQAFCGTDDCPVVTWDPTKTRAELAADMQMIDLSANLGHGAQSSGTSQKPNADD